MVNEVAGLGNHYTALFGEYDPRIVYRWNTDPKVNPWESPYAMFGGNPIINTDVLLDKYNKWYDKSSKNIFSFHGYRTNTKYFADEANLNNFNSAALGLVNSNAIFKTVAQQLYSSNKLYTIKQKYGSTASYDDASRTIEIPYRGVGKDASISKTEVFEEFFHAGQDDYYSSKGIKRSNLENEVEAKVADILSGYQDDAVNGEYKSIKSYFKTGKKDKNFESQLNTLIGDVNKLYSEYDNTEGKQWDKENDPKKVDKANVLNYLESVTDVKSKGK